MPTLTIDNREIHVPAGATILEAARELGIDIPAMCYRPGLHPATSCLACVVKVNGDGRLIPSCSTRAYDGMKVESETPEVHRARKMAIELLLARHLGDCRAPCEHICPCGMDIPEMLRHIQEDRLRDGIITVKREIALPAVLGYVCHKPCERGCRRAGADGCVSVCLLKRFVAEADLESGDPFLPACKPPSSKAVAIVGAGATGLSAAYYLLQEGHACTLFDAHEQPGGTLRYAIGEDRLPRKVLDGECGIIARMGAKFLVSTPVGGSVTFESLRAEFHAVLLAPGVIKPDQARVLGLEMAGKGVRADRHTFQTPTPGVFAAGSCLRGNHVSVQSVADGKAAARRICEFLERGAAATAAHEFGVRMPKPSAEDLARMLPEDHGRHGRGTRGSAVSSGKVEAGLGPEEARFEAGRCMNCDCRKAEACKLRIYGQLYGADPSRFRRELPAFERHTDHPEVVYEPGKCINCGICVQIATQAGEELGLSFVGRGFNVRVGVPFNERISAGLSKVAAACAAACPTAALTTKRA